MNGAALRITRRGFLGGMLVLVMLGPRLAETAAARPLAKVAPGTWAPTGSMSVAREGQSMTLLQNDQALVAGGGAGPSATAELYDPSTGTFTPTGSMNSARAGQSATLLPNGQVLIAGGQDNLGHIVSSAELYNPATGTFTPTGSMNDARAGQTATLLPNGQVLVAGGLSAHGFALASTELYNPSTGTWTPSLPLDVARYGHSATLLPSGQVLIAGGGPAMTGDETSAELIDPIAGTHSFTGNLVFPRAGHTATLLADGRVLVAGGANVDQGTYLPSAEVYDPTSGGWSLVGNMSTARVDHSASLLSNGQVLVSGGQDNTATILASSELFDPASGTWSLTGSLSTARAGHTTTTLQSGQVLAAGGDNGLIDLNSAELYTPPPGATVRVSPPRARVGRTLALGGAGFGASEPVSLSWGCTCTPALRVITSDASGLVTATLPLPPGVWGQHRLLASGLRSRQLALASVGVQPGLAAWPWWGRPGAHLRVSGFGVGASEAVVLHWGGAGGPVLGTATSNSVGTFAGTSAVTITLPPTGRGWRLIDGVGQSSGAQALGLVYVL